MSKKELLENTLHKVQLEIKDHTEGKQEIVTKFEVEIKHLKG